MANAKVYDMSGKFIEEIELDANIFGVEVNTAVIHAAVVNQLANKRQGTQSAKTKSEVSGGGKKPYRQKGTGRARQGSTRSAQWIKGGIVFAPKPRSYRYALPKKVKRLALKSALSSKAAAEEITGSVAAAGRGAHSLGIAIYAGNERGVVSCGFPL